MYKAYFYYANNYSLNYAKMNKNKVDIKQIRENQRLTQTEFAEILGVSRSTIVKVESGEVSLSKKMVAKLQNQFPKEMGVSFDNSNLISGLENDSDVLITIISTNLGSIDIAKKIISIMVSESNYTFDENKHLRNFVLISKSVDFDTFENTFNNKSIKYEYRFLLDFLKITNDCLNALYKDLFSLSTDKYFKQIFEIK